jgi:nucleoside-diphosphate-sugar epimerase
MKKVLITGGAGFIGANWVQRLLAEGGFEVFVIEKEGANLWRLNDVVDKITVRYVDLENAQAAQQAVKEIQPDHIFHLASYGVYPAIQSDTTRMLRTNIEGTLNLVEALKNQPVSSFVFTGTCTEYKEKDSNLAETDPVDPLNFYSITKLAAGLFLKKIAKDYNLPIVNLRLFTPYGYYEDAQRLIPYSILSGLRNKNIELTSPDHVRDFIFIEDLMDVFWNVLTVPEKHSGEIFNIGTGQQHRIGDVVDMVENLLGKKLQVNYGQRESYYREPNVFLADNSKTKTAFDWKPKHDFKENESLYP